MNWNDAIREIDAAKRKERNESKSITTLTLIEILQRLREEPDDSMEWDEAYNVTRARLLALCDALEEAMGELTWHMNDPGYYCHALLLRPTPL